MDIRFDVRLTNRSNHRKQCHPYFHATILPMLPVLIALLLQTASISGEVVAPKGMAAPGSAQVVLLPEEYAQMFNAEAQKRIDDYWDIYKPQFVQRKEDFTIAYANAYREALDLITLRMQAQGKVNTTNIIRNAQAGRFEFRGLQPGLYKLIATSNIGGTVYVWTESVNLKSTSVVVLMKQYVP
jgi:hypothetical protein